MVHDCVMIANTYLSSMHARHHSDFGCVNSNPQVSLNGRGGDKAWGGNDLPKAMQLAKAGAGVESREPGQDLCL